MNIKFEKRIDNLEKVIENIVSNENIMKVELN